MSLPTTSIAPKLQEAMFMGATAPKAPEPDVVTKFGPEISGHIIVVTPWRGVLPSSVWMGVLSGSASSGVLGMIVRGSDWLRCWGAVVVLGGETSGKVVSSGGVRRAAGCGVRAAMPRDSKEGSRRSCPAFMRFGIDVTSVPWIGGLLGSGGEVRVGEAWHKVPCCLSADIRQAGSTESE